MRDFLYVDNQHGAPWDDVWDWYSAWLPDVRHRSDFNQLLDMLSGEIARRYGNNGMADAPVEIAFDGTAGQSFGAFNVAGLNLTLSGDANDYVGKGMAGGQIEAVGLFPLCCLLCLHQMTALLDIMLVQAQTETFEHHDTLTTLN